MQTTSATYSAIRREDTLEICLSGDIDLFTAGEIQANVLKEIAQFKPAHLDINLTDVVFLDSAGLGMLLHFKNVNVADGNLCVIAREGSQVARVLKMGKFDMLFKVAHV